jgi:hypothetical protein
MALLWCDGFETYGTSLGARPSPDNVVARKYTTYNFQAFDDIVTGRKGLGYRFGSGSGFLRTQWLTSDSTLIVGCAVKVSTGTGSSYIFQLYSTSSRSLSLLKTSDGELKVVRESTTLEETVGLNLVADTWYFIEFKAYCHDSAGTYEVKLNGLTVMSDTGLDTQTDTVRDYWPQVGLGPGVTATITLDDFYVCDGTGSANNDFIGDCAVEVIYPNGDDSVTWTPDSGGTNYTQLDEVIADDASYVQATTGKDLYDYEPVVTENIIYGVMVSTEAELTDATSYAIKNVVSSNSVEATDTHTTIGIGLSSMDSVFEEDPNTSAAWLYGDVNVASFGVEVV